MMGGGVESSVATMTDVKPDGPCSSQRVPVPPTPNDAAELDEAGRGRTVTNDVEASMDDDEDIKKLFESAGLSLERTDQALGVDQEPDFFVYYTLKAAAERAVLPLGRRFASGCGSWAHPWPEPHAEPHAEPQADPELCLHGWVRVGRCGLVVTPSSRPARAASTTGTPGRILRISRPDDRRSTRPRT